MYLVFSLGGLLTFDPSVIKIAAVVASVLASFLIVMAIPGLIGGMGLLKRKEWARILVLILGCFNLLAFPLGTALGIYTIWTLMQDEAIKLFPTGSNKAISH